MQHCITVSYCVLLASAKWWGRMTPAIPVTHVLRPWLFLLINKDNWKKVKTWSLFSHCSATKGSFEFFFFFFKKDEGFLETESQNDFCFAVNVPGRQLEGLLLCSTYEPCSCSLEEKGESWVFRDALFILVPLHFSCSVICRSDSSSKDVFLLTPITSSLWLNHFVAVFPTTLPIWEAARLSVAACSLGRRITRNLKAALAVAVLLTMLCQAPLKSCGFYLFPFKHPVYAEEWASLHVKRLAKLQRSLCYL